MAPRAGSTPTAGRGDADPDRDPDDVGTILERFDADAWPSASPTSGVEKAAVRRAYYVVKDAGEAARHDLQRDVYDGTITNVYPSAAAWYATACEPFLRWFPRIRPPATDGGAWSFDPDVDGSGRPAVPDDPSHPADDAVDAALDDFDFPTPNADTHLTLRNRVGVRRAFETLQEQRIARPGDLKDGYIPVDVDIDGLWQTRGRWWAAVGRPALASLPWVDAPPVIGRAWRYTGTDADTDTTDA